jgi:hypothetical protein
LLIADCGDIALKLFRSLENREPRSQTPGMRAKPEG